MVEDYETALALERSSPHMGRGAVIEPYLEGGRDLNIAIRTYPDLQLSAIEAPVSSRFYDYEEKYLSGGGIEGSARELPAVLHSEIEDRIRALAGAVTEIAGIRSIARLDFLERDGELWVNEINTIPGKHVPLPLGRPADQPQADRAGYGPRDGGIESQGVLDCGSGRSSPAQRRLYCRQTRLIQT